MTAMTYDSETALFDGDTLAAVETIAKAEVLLVALDFDGTLSEIVPTPMQARPHPEAAAILSCLAAATGGAVVGESFYQFEPQGVTGTVLLAESHIAIHTWPEAGFVTVDVYVCNLHTDNTAKAEHVFHALESALKPTEVRFHSIRRGGGHA